MDVPLSKIYVVFLLANMSCVSYGQTTCLLPQPGRCSRSNFTINSNEVCDVKAGSCSFTQASGLCSYRQGCADPHMTNWTLEQGHIQAKQNGIGQCGSDFYYSVLESPWLNISHPSCLIVWYLRTNPAALDVFLELRTGRFLPLLNRLDNAGINVANTFKTSEGPGIGKILLRAYGGSGGGGSRVVIYRVTLESGNCTWSGGLSGSHNITDAEPMTSPLISPTQDAENRTDCIAFEYGMEQSGSWLTVSIQLLSEERRTAIWNKSSSVSDEENDGKCPLQVIAPFKIIFTGHSPNSGRSVNVSNIVFRRWQRKADCSLCPLTASTFATDALIKPLDTTTSASPVQCASPSTSTSTVSLSTTTPKPTTKPALFGSSSAQATPFITTSDTTGHAVDPFMDGNKGDSENSDSALISGVVAAVAVVIVIIVIIVVILICRRRRLKRNIPEPQDTASDDGIAMPEVNQKHEDTMMDDAVDVTVPSHYDAVEELSPPNLYSSLQARQRDVTNAQMTSAAPSTDVNRMEGASYYNVGGQARPEANCYYNVDAAVPPSVKEDDDGYEVPVSKASMGFRP